MTKEKAWKLWDSYHDLQQKIIQEQGVIINAYIEANKDKLKTVNVRDRYTSEVQLTPMLQIPSTYNNYYHHNGNFYKKDIPRNREIQIPYVNMLIGEELKKLWQNQDFVKSLLGMDLSTGACQP